MTTPPGPYDDAIAALGVQINGLTQDLKSLRDGHAAKADLEAVRAEISEARKELKALRDKSKPEPEPKPKPKSESEPEPLPLPEPEAEGCAGGYFF